MNHNAAHQHERERYNSRREKNPYQFLKILFHDGCCTVHARVGTRRCASYVVDKLVRDKSA